MLLVTPVLFPAMTSQNVCGGKKLHKTTTTKKKKPFLHKINSGALTVDDTRTSTHLRKLT